MESHEVDLIEEAMADKMVSNNIEGTGKDSMMVTATTAAKRVTLPSIAAPHRDHVATAGMPLVVVMIIIGRIDNLPLMVSDCL